MSSNNVEKQQEKLLPCFAVMVRGACAGSGCLLCYWAENNVSLIEGEFDLKEKRLKIHVVIGPTSCLPNAPGTRINFILLTFYCLVNLSCIWTELNLADKGWMLLPLESILQSPQEVLSPGAVYARGSNSPIPLFQKKMQIAIAFLPGGQSWIDGKCQPLLLYFGSALLEGEQHLAAPKITALCSSAGPNHNSAEKLRLPTCPCSFQDGEFSTNLTPCAFGHCLPQPTTPKERSIYVPFQARYSSNLNNN